MCVSALIRTYDEILDSIKSAYFRECGNAVEENSETEKMFELLASELFSISCYGDYIFKQAFVQTATGENLDKLGEIRGCIRKTAAPATGELTFSINEAADEDIIIPERTVCSVDGKAYMQFSTIGQAVIKAGETSATVGAVSLENGAFYNVDKNSITVMVNAPVGITAVTNENEFDGGYSDECDAMYRGRILRHYGVSPNGINCASYENMIMTLDYVTDCNIVPSTREASMKIYVSTKSNTLNDEQKNEIAHMIPIIDAAGVSYDVLHSKKMKYSLFVSAEIMDGFDEEKIENEIIRRINSVAAEARIGENIPISRLERAIDDIDGVVNISIRSSRQSNNSITTTYAATLTLNGIEVSIRSV